MKKHRNTVYVFVTVALCLIAYYTEWNAYWMLLLNLGIVLILNTIYTDERMNEETLLNKELREQIRSTAKDSHVKTKQLMTIVSSIPFPILLLDHYGNIVMHNKIDVLEMANQEFEKITYINNAFFHSVSEFIKDAFIMERHMDKIITINSIEYQAISVPVLAKQKFSGCLILFQDVSKTLEGEKMQKRFIADASHELKTPISVIKGMIEILNRDEYIEESLRKDFLQQIELEINSLDVLVKDLLLLSRLSKATIILSRERVEMKKLIEDSCRTIEKSCKDKGLELVIDVEKEEHVFCDPKKMMQVIINLLTNAIKYSESGTITIRGKQEETMYMIEVEDQGCGIEASKLPKIFDRFYRVNDDRNRKTGGTGLGLSIVQSIIDAHDGKIEVESTYKKGSIFRIYLKN